MHVVCDDKLHAPMMHPVGGQPRDTREALRAGMAGGHCGRRRRLTVNGYSTVQYLCLTRAAGDADVLVARRATTSVFLPAAIYLKSHNLLT